MDSRNQIRNFKGGVVVVYAGEINVSWIFWKWGFWFGFVVDGCLDARPVSASPGAGDQ